MKKMVMRRIYKAHKLILYEICLYKNELNSKMKKILWSFVSPAVYLLGLICKSL